MAYLRPGAQMFLAMQLDGSVQSSLPREKGDEKLPNWHVLPVERAFQARARPGVGGETEMSYTGERQRCDDRPPNGARSRRGMP